MEDKTMAKKNQNNNETKNVQNAQVANQYNVITYTTKKGGTACYIAGFNTEADAKAIADQLPHSISNSYRYNDKGEKVFVLSFGTRYVDVATALCHALNKGSKTDIHKYIADCHEIYNAVVAAGKAEREAKKAERKAQKQEDDAKKLETIKKKNGLMSQEEVTELLKGVIAGDKDAMAIVNKMMGKAA